MKEKILEKIKIEDIISLLKDYGSVCYEQTDKQLVFRTVCHGGDSHKLYYYPDTKLFVCYTNCGSMDIFGLISRAENCSYSDAIKTMAKRIGIKYSNREGFNKKYREFEDYSINYIYYNGYINGKTQRKYDESILDYFDSNTFYKGWIDEGISIDSMIKFGIRWDEVNKRIIIPVLNLDGELIGVRYRTLINDDILPQYVLDDIIDYRFETAGKYKPLYCNEKLYTFDTGNSLYGLFENQNAIRKYRKAIVFEGEKSVLKCNTWFGAYPAVATYGCNISEQQINKLNNIGITKLILAYDQDKNNENKNICKRINNMRIKCYYLDGTGLLGEKDSPVDKGKEIYMKLLKNKLR